MKINEKLTKPITEVNYLRAENVDRYRVIIEASSISVGKH